MTDEDVQKIFSGENIVFSHGKIIYYDVFNKPHWTTYNMRYSPVKKRFEFCETHNDFDVEGSP